MGYCYYGNYAAFLEMGRVECLRMIGIVYSELEQMGILLPVKSLEINYLLPAKYDNLLTLTTQLVKLNNASLEFHYEIWNESNVKITAAKTTLVFVSTPQLKPMRTPGWIVEKLKVYEIIER
jgi:acyl-CoA thioester hydrolase